jgi:hypothetical protein
MERKLTKVSMIAIGNKDEVGKKCTVFRVPMMQSPKEKVMAASGKPMRSVQ